MTNDEAVQWCSDNNVKITFIPGNPNRVQVYVQIPLSNSPLPIWASKIRETLADAVTAVKAASDSVASGSVSPSDPSLVDLKMPDQPARDPSLAGLRLPDPTPVTPAGNDG